MKRDKRGALITDRSGIDYLVVCPARPDALGRSGVMLANEWHGSIGAEIATYCATAPVPAEVPIVAEIPPAEQLPPADWPETITADVIEAVAAEHARVERLLAEQPGRPEAGVWMRSLEAMAFLLRQWRGRLNAIEAEEAAERERAKGPSAEEVERMTAVLGYSREVAALGYQLSPRQASALLEKYAPHVNFMFRGPDLAAVEVRATEEWFRSHGLAIPDEERITS